MISGSLGPVLFYVTRQQVQTFSGLARKRASRFAEHAVLEGLPRVQHTGREQDTLSLTVHLASPYPTDKGTWLAQDANLASLLSLQNSGEECPLVLGLFYWGLWVIESADVSYNNFQAGYTLAASVNLSLKEYN